MGKLRQRLEDELKLRGYSEATARIYVRAVRMFAEHHHCSPERLGSADVRAYLLHVTSERHWSWSTVNQALCALKFFYTQILNRPFEVGKIPYQKRKRKLPTVLSVLEVSSLLAAAGNLKDKVVLMALYSAGLRLRELIHLQPSDVDSCTMKIRVREAKGGHERNVMLSSTLLAELRRYFKRYRPGPWLFYGQSREQRLHPRTVERLVRVTAQKAGLSKQVTPHTLRHSFATHLLEHGTSLVYIQELLGHRHLKSTLIYTHVSGEALSRVVSPLDRLPLSRAS